VVILGLIPAYEPPHDLGYLGQDVADAGDDPLVAGAAQQDRALADPDRTFKLYCRAGGGDPLRAGDPGAPVVDLFIARGPDEQHVGSRAVVSVGLRSRPTSVI
jgi:hypothetical protein